MPEISDAALEGLLRQTVSAVLDRLCVPFLLIAGDGSVDYANSLAKEIAADGRHFAVGPEGKLVLHSPAAALALRDFLAALASGPAEIDLLLASTGEAPPRFASVSAFTPPGMAGMAAWRPVAVVFIREGDDEEGIAVARQRYGLSEAEAGVLTSIIAGVSVGQHAERRNISVHTARKQLNAVMAKMGVSRQAELAGIIDALNFRGRDIAAAQAMALHNGGGRD